MKTILLGAASVLALALGCSDNVGGEDPLVGTSAGSPAAAASGGAASGGLSSVAGSTNGGSVTTGGSVTGTAGSAGQTASGGLAATGGQGGTGGAVPTDGKGLYDLNCKACHGEQGSGSPLAPETRHPVRDYSTWVARNGRAQTTYMAPMDKFGTDKLSDAQLNLIWDYLDQPPQPTTGKDLYGDYCANCHGADGKGGPTTRNIVNEVQNVLKMVRSGKNVGQYQMRKDSMPIFSTMRISDPELTLIHDYVDSF